MTDTFALPDEALHAEEVPESEWEDVSPPPVDDDPPSLEWLDAPELAGLVKGAQTAKARLYRQKIESGLKVVARARFQANTPSGDADCAAVFAFGPSFATNLGNLADADEKAARAIDLITSPDSPYLMFAVSAIPLISQLMRNHEGDAQAIRAGWRNRKAKSKAEKPKLTLKLGRFNLRIPMPVRINLTGYLRTQALDPQALSNAVFSNPDIQKAINKQGWQRNGRPAPNAKA